MTETPGTSGREAHLGHAEGAVLRADELIAGYMPEVNILNGADLYCHENELVGIIGPNGAGKSTLLKAMFGLVKISSGSVTLKGEDITNHRADALVTAGIGFVPQNNNVFPTLTIAENLEMGVFQAPKTFNAGSTSSATCSPPCATVAASAPARCPAASGRWSPWAAH